MNQNNKHYQTTVKPNIDIKGNVSIAAGDLIFDWTAFEIPKGSAALKAIHAYVAGTNGADIQGTRDIELLFAKSVNAVAPPTLGDTGDAITGQVSQASRPYIIGRAAMDGSAMRGSVHLISYNWWTMSGKQGNDTDNVFNILEGDADFPGDSNHSKTTPGYQTIWVAAIAVNDAFDFGTDVALNQAGHQAISTSAVDLVTSGTDPRLVFAVGDEVVSFVASDGSSPKQVGVVKSIPDNVSLEVESVTEAFNHTTELCNRNPIQFRFEFQY